MTQVDVSPCRAEDMDPAAQVLSLAMLDNPLHQAVFQGAGEGARQKIEAMFGRLFRELPRRILLARQEGRIIGVMRMKPCQGSEPPQETISPKEPLDQASRVTLWHTIWARNDPREPHWHLGPIGVLPQEQGKGIGTVLMSHFCDRVDQEGRPAYLETDLAQNVRFYQKFGFEVTAQTNILGVANSFMWRPAKEP